MEMLVLWSSNPIIKQLLRGEGGVDEASVSILEAFAKAVAKHIDTPLTDSDSDGQCQIAALTVHCN